MLKPSTCFVNRLEFFLELLDMQSLITNLCDWMLFASIVESKRIGCLEPTQQVLVIQKY
jgi:hypothetical protein